MASNTVLGVGSICRRCWNLATFRNSLGFKVCHRHMEERTEEAVVDGIMEEKELMEKVPKKEFIYWNGGGCHVFGTLDDAVHSSGYQNQGIFERQYVFLGKFKSTRGVERIDDVEAKEKE